MMETCYRSITPSHGYSVGYFAEPWPSFSSVAQSRGNQNIGLRSSSTQNLGQYFRSPSYSTPKSTKPKLENNNRATQSENSFNYQKAEFPPLSPNKGQTADQRHAESPYSQRDKLLGCNEKVERQPQRAVADKESLDNYWCPKPGGKTLPTNNTDNDENGPPSPKSTSSMQEFSTRNSPNVERRYSQTELRRAKTSASQNMLDNSSMLDLMYLPKEIAKTTHVDNDLPTVFIDGCNVCLYPKQESFSAKKLENIVYHFWQRHYDVKVVLPLRRVRVPSLKQKPPVTNQEILDKLESAGFLILVPDKKIDLETIEPYDDLVLVQHAFEANGIIVSNDDMRDVKDHYPEFREIIERRVVFTVCGDSVLPALDSNEAIRHKMKKQTSN